MKLPEMHGFEVLGLIGMGESGKVFAARKEECGALYAVKVFEGMGINRGLLAKMTERLEVGGWPEGLVKVDSADFEGRPACWVVPFLGEVDGERWLPRSLQHRLDEHPGEGTWGLVREMADALAGMHRRRVAHGNLKPGNVFFDDEGRVALSDWVLGNMPGITHFDFTDALLYQAPEQLLDSGGYFEEEGYGWDVFSFGVLSYRLLTGRFPRCDETFSGVAPECGKTRVEGMHADMVKIVRGLEAWDEVVWPTEASNDLERGYREWIDRCLSLERVRRPVTMMEVVAGFEAVEREVEGHQAREVLMDQRRGAERRLRRVAFFAGMVSVGFLVAGALWYGVASQLRSEKVMRAEEKEHSVGKLNDMGGRMERAEKERDVAVRKMEYEVDLGMARLEASRMMGDRLFEWAMEKGLRRLPALEDRELRLKRLEGYYEEFLRWSEGNERLEEERAMARLQLAEVSLAAGDVEKGRARLEEAMEVWSGRKMDGVMKLRMGRDALLLAILKQEKAGEGVAEAFVKARDVLKQAEGGGVDEERLRYLVAVLDFHEARIFAEKGEDEKALGQLLEATKALNELADARPDSAILRSELAACYLSSAGILEGIGNVGDAREVRGLAAVELAEMLEKKAGDVDLMLELAGCYGAMAEAAVMSGDVGAAEDLSKQAVGLLDEVLKVMPESGMAATRKAAQLGLKAGLLRDEGKSEEALAAYDEGIKLIERLGGKRDGMASYRLALLWWQKGRMLGYGGEKREEVVLLGKARELLRDLEAEAGGLEGLRVEDLQRSGAYLLGDYAHALELVGKKDEAGKAYREAMVLWEGLLKARPESEEYEEGLDWIREGAKRLEEGEKVLNFER